MSLMKTALQNYPFFKNPVLTMAPDTQNNCPCAIELEILITIFINQEHKDL